MARPRKYDEARVATGMRLPASLHERLLAAAEERDVSANWIMERAIKEFLDHLIPVDEIVLTRHAQAANGRSSDG